MSEVRLEVQEWNQLLAILSQAPWNVANPLIMKIAPQLQEAQSRRDAQAAARSNGEDIRPPDRN
jgi:hypothetical protein